MDIGCYWRTPCSSGVNISELMVWKRVQHFFRGVAHRYFFRYEIALRSIGMSSPNIPMPILHFPHNNPLIFPVSWQWSIANALFPLFVLPHIAHKPLLFSNITLYSSNVSLNPDNNTLDWKFFFNILSGKRAFYFSKYSLSL